MQVQVGAELPQRREHGPLPRHRPVADHGDRRPGGAAGGLERRGDVRSVLDSHHQQQRPAQAPDRVPVDQRVAVVGRDVAGDHREVVGDPAVGDRDAGHRRHSQGAGETGDHADGHAGGATRLDLLEPPAEHEAVAPLEARHPLTGERPLDDQPVDLLLARGPAARQLRHVDQLGRRRQVAQQLARSEAVGDHQVGLHQRATAGHRDQLGVTGAAADQRHAGDRRPAFAGRDRPLVEPGDDGVADRRRTPRLAAPEHRQGQSVVPPHGRGPRRRRGRVVRPDAEDAGGLGDLGDVLVHRRVVRRRDHVPGVVQVLVAEPALDPGHLARTHLSLDRRRDLRRDDHDLRTGREQPGDAPLGDVPATDDQHPAARQPEARGVRRVVGHHTIIVVGSGSRQARPTSETRRGVGVSTGSTDERDPAR